MNLVGRYTGVLDQLGVPLSDGECPPQGIRMELPGGVDALPEADYLGMAVEIDQTAGTIRLGDQQAQRIGAAVDGRNLHENSSRHGGNQNAPSSSTVSSPNGFTPRPAARA